MKPILHDLQGRLWVLVVSKRFGRRRIAALHAPKPFNIISKRDLVDHRRYEASIAFEASIDASKA
jgi:hypothetical protein